MMEVLANAMMVIILQYINVTNQYVVHLKFTPYVNYISLQLEITGDLREPSSETEIAVLQVYYLLMLGFNTCGREGKEAGLGRKKVGCEVVSTMASVKPIEISGAGMALQSCPASG